MLCRTLLLGFVLTAASGLFSACKAQSVNAPLAPAIGQSFQIENASSPGQLLRPQDANNADGTPIVLYPKTSWRCMTWRMDAAPSSATTQPGELTVHLYNHFTHKTLMPDPSSTDATRPVIERGLTKELSDAELWKFVPVADGLYRIEHVPTGLTLAATAEGSIIVGKYTGEATQQWRLLPKPEKFTG